MKLPFFLTKPATLSVVERCVIVSSVLPQEWPEEVVWPISSRRDTIFGAALIPMGRTHSINILDALIDTRLCDSKTEARTLVKGNAISVNGKKITDIKAMLGAADVLPNIDCIVLKRGKGRDFGLIEMSDEGL